MNYKKKMITGIYIHFASVSTINTFNFQYIVISVPVLIVRKWPNGSKMS